MISAALHSDDTATAAMCIGLLLFAAALLYVQHRIGILMSTRARARLAELDASCHDAVARAVLPPRSRPVVSSRPARSPALRTVH